MNKIEENIDGQGVVITLPIDTKPLQIRGLDPPHKIIDVPERIIPKNFICQIGDVISYKLTNKGKISNIKNEGNHGKITKLFIDVDNLNIHYKTVYVAFSVFKLKELIIKNQGNKVTTIEDILASKGYRICGFLHQYDKNGNPKSEKKVLLEYIHTNET